MDWSKFYPDFFPEPEVNGKSDEEIKKIQSHKAVEFADIGCGYGGLLGNH